MNNLFNQNLKESTQNKYSFYKLLTIISFVISFILVITLLFLHDSFKKITFILILTIILTFLIIVLQILIKTTLYYNKLNKLINSNLLCDVSIGIINKIDIYNITINGLVYKQYELLGETNQIIYILDGIDIDNILNKKIKAHVLNNIMYAYEVLNEQ